MKKILAILLCLLMVLSTVACGDSAADPSGSDTASSEVGVENSGTSDVLPQEPGDTSIPEDTAPNQVIAIDQIKERLVIYDFDLYEEGDALDDLEIWEKKITHAAGVKYREDTVFGDVIIVAGNRSQIIEYPSGKEIWGTNNPGNNSHSIEILPSGNIVIANSTGGNLRMFYTSGIAEGNAAKAQSYVDFELSGAHGVLWDPEYDVLWGLGNYELVAYSVDGEGVSETLVENPDLGDYFKSSVSGSGHDLQPDYADSRYLYFTAGGVYRYDKEKNKVLSTYPYSNAFQLPEVKGFSGNVNGKFFSTGLLGGKGKFFDGHWKESWLTDTIIFYYRQAKDGTVTMQKLEVAALESAFYKVRSFNGTYQ